MLNRIVTVTSGGLDYEADQKHAEILIKDMGVDGGGARESPPRGAIANGGKR